MTPVDQHALSPRASLQVDDQALHPLMRAALRGYSASAPLERAWIGARLNFGAIRLLSNHRELWPWALAPALINMAVLLGTLAVTLPAASSSLGAFWAEPAIQGWIDYPIWALWGVVFLFAMALALVLSYMLAMVLGSVIASPFNDVLSEKTEQVLLGARHVQAGEGAPFLAGVVRSMLSSAAVAGIYVAIMAPLLLLHLIPAVGSVAYTLLGGLIGGYFVALEHCDTLLERRGVAFRQKLAIIWRERTLTLGFGVGTSLMLAIPLLNFLCLPVAVIGGTALGTALLDSPELELEPAPQLESSSLLRGAHGE